MEFLRVESISLEERGQKVLQGISFGQAAGQRLGLAGESGVGKSTLLQAVAGLVQPTAGQMWFEGRRVKGPQEQLVPGHPGIAYLSQHFELPKFLRVEQVLRYANQRPTPEAAALYEVCRISHLLARQTNQLSGGERQRIALARLVLGAPRLLLLDEPFSNLDRGHKQVLRAVIDDLGARLNITCLLVSHDPLDLLSWADELLVLRAGQLVQQGPPTEVYYRPADEYTAGLLGDYHLLTGPLARQLAPPAARRRRALRLLLRPEQLRLHAAPAPEAALPGTVAAVQFFGSYWEVMVQVAGHTLRARVSEAPPAVGAAVGLTVVKDAGWVL